MRIMQTMFGEMQWVLLSKKIQNTVKILEIHRIKNAGNIKFNLMSHEDNITKSNYVYDLKIN